MEWVSMPKQLHASLASASTMPSIGGGVEESTPTSGLWSSALCNLLCGGTVEEG